MKQSTRLYAVFKRTRGCVRWHRVSMHAYKKSYAIRVFQAILLDAILTNATEEYRLRPIN
jgi:hypothetical protein